MSIILGFNEGHDGSVCVVKNGKVLAAVSTERVTRVKKQKGWTSETIDYVLDAAGINIDDVDHWVMADTKQEIYGNNTKTTEDGTVIIPPPIPKKPAKKPAIIAVNVIIKIRNKI